MKNLAHLPIEKIELLPSRESNVEYFTRTLGNSYNRKKERWRRKEYLHPILNRILKNNIGKSFNMAFHYFCTKVRPWHKYEFFKEFENIRKYQYQRYYCDDQGIIRRTKRQKSRKRGPFIFKSIDYRTEYRHKVTFEKIKYPIGYWGHKTYGKGYAEYVVSGFKMEFESRKDKLYQRLMAEKKKQQKKYYLPSFYMSDEKFKEILNKGKIEDTFQNKLKILAKGFDPVTSFRR